MNPSKMFLIKDLNHAHKKFLRLEIKILHLFKKGSPFDSTSSLNPTNKKTNP
jgi:hypothetical protein